MQRKKPIGAFGTSVGFAVVYEKVVILLWLIGDLQLEVAFLHFDASSCFHCLGYLLNDGEHKEEAYGGEDGAINDAEGWTEKATDYQQNAFLQVHKAPSIPARSEYATSKPACPMPHAAVDKKDFLYFLFATSSFNFLQISGTPNLSASSA